MIKTQKCWVKDYVDYRIDNESGPARVYWRKADIDRQLRQLSNGATGEADVQPATEWNKYSEVGYVVAETVPVYRVVRR